MDGPNSSLSKDTQAYGKGMSLAIPNPSPPPHGAVDQAFRQALGPCLGTCLALPDSLWLPCTPPGPDRSTGGGGWIADASFDALPRSILPFWLGSAAICILQ